MSTLLTLAARWRAAKADEEEARNRRWDIEGRIIEELGISPDDFNGTEDAAGLKVTGRPTLAVDGARLEAICATDAALTEYGRRLFRWKPELDKKAWDRAPLNVKDALAPAITRKPGKPSFSAKD